MSDAPIIPPADLVNLKCRFLEADREYKQICDSFPSGQQIVALLRNGLNPIADEDAQRSHDAYRLCIDLAKLIQRDGWWRTQPSRADADKALTEAARARLAENRAAPVG